MLVALSNAIEANELYTTLAKVGELPVGMNLAQFWDSRVVFVR